MNDLVKILEDDYGEPREKEFQFWHLSVNEGGVNQTFCEGEVYGPAVGVTKFKQKKTFRGGITCKECIEKIKKIKAIKL